MDGIKEKLLKIKAMADRGEFYEAEVAKRQLNILLNKYNMKIEDLFDDTEIERGFRYKNLNEFQIFIQLISLLYGERSNGSTFNKRKKILYMKLSNYEYAELESIYSFHIKNFAKEKRSLMKNLMNAYCIKHDLLVDSSDENKKHSDEEIRQYLQALKMSQNMSDVTYHKQLNK